jgi:Mlc titration factor MtfA (ptsG expression regulator)
MDPWLFLGLVTVGIVLALWIPRWRLRRAIQAPFPEDWEAILQRNVEVYRALPEPLQQRLRALIKRFLHEKHFSGAQGLEITDEIRVTVAAEACMLILNRPGGVYPTLRYIIVYPSAFLVEHEARDETGVVARLEQGRLGESWHNGKVILAWDSVLHGAYDVTDGVNVVLHEFAHQLDTADGLADGTPPLHGEHSYRRWASVLSEEFEELRHSAYRGRETLLDHYGATDPAEFFAVATETFFERSAAMAKYHPELFGVLQTYYRLDPREWRRD